MSDDSMNAMTDDDFPEIFLQFAAIGLRRRHDLERSPFLIGTGARAVAVELEAERHESKIGRRAPIQNSPPPELEVIDTAAS